MKYNFTDIIDRQGKDAIAIDLIPIPEAQVEGAFTKIPMWVADMNFATCPSIPEAMIKRSEHPLYGYFNMPDEYYDSIIDWQKRRNAVEDLKAEYIGYENGVLGGVQSALAVLTSKGDNVLVHSPTYIGFTSILENNGYNIIHSELIEDEDGIIRMDYEDMDAKLKKYNIHVAIFCSPHNPSGRVWERWEIEKALEVYKNNDCFVISDEIWSDLILAGKHIPTQSINEDAKNRTVALYAPSKTFNLAGLVGSYHIIYNKWLRDRILKESSLTHYNQANIISVHALIGAYKEEGHEWLDELIEVLRKNIDYGYNFITDRFKGVKVHKPEGTYLLYLDCSQWLEENKMTIDELLKEGVKYGVIWQDGRPFNKENSIRMNLALPYSLVVEAFDRLDKYVFNK